VTIPSVYAVGTVSSVTTGAATPGIPAGTTTDDGLFLFVEAANEPLNTITGYTRIGSGAVVQATGLVTDLSAFYKRAGASETAPSVTATPQNHLIARIVGVRGIDWTGSPINVISTGVDNGTGTAFSIPGGTTTAVDCLVFAALSTGTDVNSTAMATGWTSTTTFASPALTEQVDNWTASGNGGGIAVAVGGRAAAGAYNAITGTLSTGNTKAFMSFAVKGVTAVAYTQTPTDSAGLTDAAILARSLVFTDSAGLTDAGFSFVSDLTKTDLVGLTDAAVLSGSPVFTDSAGLTDAVALARSLAFTDLAGLTDVAITQAAKLITQTDDAGLTDTGFSLDIDELLTDSAGLTDTAAFSQGKVFIDSAGLTDAASFGAGLSVTATDSAGLTDTAALDQQKLLTDSAGLTDAAAFTVAPVFTDSAGLSDAATIQAGKAVITTDDAGLTDVAAIQRGLVATDFAGLTDTVALDQQKPFTDSAGLTDTSSVSSGKLLDLTDSAGLTDGQVFAQTKVYTDSVGLTDVAALIVSRVFTDSAGITDQSAVGLLRDLIFTDSAGLADTQITARGLQFTDSAGLSDVATLARSSQMTFTDSAGLSDAAGIGSVIYEGGIWAAYPNPPTWGLQTLEAQWAVSIG